jgi:hypothetical protein
VVLAPAAALVLAALCLRAPFSAVGPVLGELGDELSLPQAALSVLPTLPLVCFGLVSPVAPALAARLGVQRAVLAGLVVLAAGIALRTAGTWGLYVGTVLLSAGIAVGNVLVPAARAGRLRGPRGTGAGRDDRDDGVLGQPRRGPGPAAGHGDRGRGHRAHAVARARPGGDPGDGAARPARPARGRSPGRPGCRWSPSCGTAWRSP